MKEVKFMAIPKNEEEWTIYYELIKEYNENSVLDKATRHLIEAFKNDQQQENVGKHLRKFYMNLDDAVDRFIRNHILVFEYINKKVLHKHNVGCDIVVILYLPY